VILPKHEIKVGQFKLPITMEGYGSSSRLDFAERSTLARTFGDQRDMGVMVESAGVPFVEYQVALVNGAGKNSFDNGPRKDVVARLALKPIPGVSVGGSTYLGETYDSSIGAYKMKNRAGVEAAVEQYGAMLKFEYMGGRDDLGSTVDGLVRAKPEGAYVTAGYRFGSAQLVARYDQFKSDTSAELGACQAGGSLAGNARCTKVHSFSAGINYDFHKILHNAKLQLDYYYDVDEVQKKHASEVYLVGQVKL
jgi:phosphate-selective porin